MEQAKKYKKIKIITLLSFIILFAIYLYMSYRANYLQILEIGEEYLNIFKINNEYKIKLFVFSFTIIFILVYINNIIIKRGLKVFFEDEKKQMPRLPNLSIAFILSVIGGIIITTVFLDKFILYVNTTLFGVTDPVFGFDIGFYFFQKPFVEMILHYIITILVILVIYVATYYIAVFNLFLNSVDKEILVKSKFIKLLKFYSLLIVIGIALTTFLGTYDVVFDKFITLKDVMNTAIIGAGLTDITIKVWGYRILSFVMVISAIFILKYLFDKKKTKKLLISVCIVPSYLVIVFVVMVLFKALFVNSNRLDKEIDYIGYNIDYTKSAYNLTIEEKEYESSPAIDESILKNNEDIVENIQLVDEETNLKTLNVLQTNSGYYSYKTSRIQKYAIDGKDTLVYISPREIDAMSDTNTYNNKTYEYTHGFGSILTYASRVSDTGNIMYVQKNFDQNSNQVYVQEPRIYFGVQTDNTIIVNSNNQSEFDYPINTTSSAENTYNGKAGIKVGFIDKLILSIMNKDVNITFSSTNDNSKILLNRNVITRAKKIMPNLLYDEEPYLIISDEGRQIWVLDAYTISDEYPYSQKTTIKTGDYKKEINYIRNSVKVLVDAYDGTIDFYITDTTDPIAVAYSNAYPGLFKDINTLSNGITSHFLYSEYLYNVQAEVLKIYHNVSEDVLYRGNDIWSYASFIATSKTTAKTEIEPYYTMIKDEEKNKVGLMVPYTIEGKQNITSYLIGTISDDGKQQLKLYKYALGSNVLGPEQLDREIEQDETISEQIKSVNVTGTKITKDIIIVPIGNSLLYVEPIYQQQLNEKNSIPLLKKVVVASGSKVAIGDNLTEALENLVSQSAVDIKVENTDTLNDLINTIIEANENLKDSTSSQNFEMIGKDITKLQTLIEQLKQQQETYNKEEKDEINESKNNNVKNVVN